MQNNARRNQHHPLTSAVAGPGRAGAAAAHGHHAGGRAPAAAAGERLHARLHVHCSLVSCRQRMHGARHARKQRTRQPVPLHPALPCPCACVPLCACGNSPRAWRPQAAEEHDEAARKLDQAKGDFQRLTQQLRGDLDARTTELRAALAKVLEQEVRPGGGLESFAAAGVARLHAWPGRG